MLEESNGKGAVYIYQLEVKNNDYPDSFNYCNIIEIYSPQYLTSEWLKEIYEEDYLQYKAMTPKLIEIMNSIRACIAEI